MVNVYKKGIGPTSRIVETKSRLTLKNFILEQGKAAAEGMQVVSIGRTFSGKAIDHVTFTRDKREVSPPPFTDYIDFQAEDETYHLKFIQSKVMEVT